MICANSDSQGQKMRQHRGCYTRSNKNKDQIIPWLQAANHFNPKKEFPNRETPPRQIIPGTKPQAPRVLKLALAFSGAQNFLFYSQART